MSTPKLTAFTNWTKQRKNWLSPEEEVMTNSNCGRFVYHNCNETWWLYWLEDQSGSLLKLSIDDVKKGKEVKYIQCETFEDCQYAAKAVCEDKMRHYLVKMEIRDGEFEYYEMQIMVFEEEPTEEQIIEEYTCSTIDIDHGNGWYETIDCRRWFCLHSSTEIKPEHVDILEKYI